MACAARGLEVVLESLDHLGLSVQTLLERADLRGGRRELFLRVGRAVVTRDRLLGFLDLDFQGVDALEELLLIHLRAGLVRAQAVDARFQRGVRLLLLAQRVQELRDEALAALHEPLEVRGLG